MRLRKRQLEELHDVIYTSTVDLSYNKLTFVDLDMFHVKRVILAYNNVACVKISKRNEHLEFLDLSHNQIASIPNDLFTLLPNLRVLKIQGNKIESLPDPSGCEKMRELWIGDCLGGNNITQLPSLPSSLRVLMAANNQLTGIEMHPNLEVVDVSNNKLGRLPVMEGCLALRAPGNQITGGQSLLERMPKLELLDVCRNDLRIRFHSRLGLTILQDYGNEHIDTMFAQTLLGLCMAKSMALQISIPRHLCQ